MSRPQKTRKRLFVLGEGNTELAYIQEFAKYNNPSIKTILVAKNSSRTFLLKKALEFATNNKKDAWIIFDQDDKIEEAKEVYKQVEIFNKKNKAKIHIAYLAPCFEIWPLIHFKYNNIPHLAKDVQKALSTHMEYDHSKNPLVDVSKLQEGYDNAVKIARNWEKSLVDAPEYEAQFFAGIYKLTESIKNT